MTRKEVILFASLTPEVWQFNAGAFAVQIVEEGQAWLWHWIRPHMSRLLEKAVNDLLGREGYAHCTQVESLTPRSCQFSKMIFMAGCHLFMGKSKLDERCKILRTSENWSDQIATWKLRHDNQKVSGTVWRRRKTRATRIVDGMIVCQRRLLEVGYKSLASVSTGRKLQAGACLASMLQRKVDTILSKMLSRTVMVPLLLMLGKGNVLTRKMGIV